MQDVFAPPANHDLGAEPREKERHDPAHARAAAGDQEHLAVQQIVAKDSRARGEDVTPEAPLFAGVVDLCI